VREKGDADAGRVTVFMSNNHIDPDLGVEIFILQPEPNGREPEET
jgi:hypothetical protein